MARQTDLWLRMRARLAAIGERAIIVLGMFAMATWPFVGSLLMGLTTPQTSQPRMVQIWLAGVAAIVVLSGTAAWLAGQRPDE